VISKQLTVRELETDNGRWNRFVADHPDGTAFHRWEWKRLHEQVFGHRTHFVALECDGELRGVLPMIATSSPVFGKFLVSMPYVNYGGPLVLDPADAALLCDYARRIGEGRDLVELRTTRPLETDLTLSQRKVTVILDLVPGNSDAVFQQFPSKLRSQIRRAGKDGIEVKFGVDQLPAFMDVLHANMRDLGSPAHGLPFYRHLVDSFGDDVWIGCAYLGDQPVAAGMAFRYGDEMEISWASSLREFNKLSPNMSLYWAFIKRATESGLSRFNFGRCSPDSGTHKFKLQWGGQTHPLFWYQVRRGAVAETPSANGRVFTAAAKVWRQLPVSLTRRLGPLVVQGIP
jgi:serine/alanine adding enzyme